MARLNLFSIPPGAAFLPTLAEAMLSGGLGLDLEPSDPLRFARVTLYLPNRRSAAAFADLLGEALRRHTGRAAALLPRILPLGGLDEAEVDIAAESFGASETPPLPPAIEPLRRRLILARQIELWGRSVNRACLRLDKDGFRLIPDRVGEAVDLAGRLADLLDSLHTSGVPFEALTRLEAARFDQFWSFTLDFLAIAGRWWPAILAEEGALDPADRRNRLIDAECARIAGGRIAGPVIAAGSTGSVPATARLLAAIARSPQGAVVLPGLDQHLDDDAWALLSAPRKGLLDAAISHPQAMLARLLAGIGAHRIDVVELGAPAQPLAARARLVAEALRPAETTGRWRESGASLSEAERVAALADVAIIEATDEREEALAIALALREGLEKPGAEGVLSAALVTADRGLAERVSVELMRWGIAADDSAGQSLGRTQAGHLARLIVDWPAQGFAAGTLVALLANPLPRLGFEREALRRAAAALEIAALRGRRPPPGFAGLREALKHAPDRIGEGHAPRPRRRISPDDLAQAGLLLDRLETALGPLLRFSEARAIDPAEAARAHFDALAALTETEDGPAAFAGEAGEALADLLTRLAEQPGLAPRGDLGDYADVIASLIDAEVVPRRMRAGPRIAILGLLEARLLDAPLLVLGGLNEGVWPPEVETDPFLNRPMRAELGLSAPERRIGQSAHDFTQGFGNARVVLSRATKAGLRETVPSRFWQRLQAVTPEPVWREAGGRGAAFVQWARALEHPETDIVLEPPAPRPEARLQPVRFSVTEVETLYRDPYALYAAKILKLDELEPLEPALGASDRGSLLHEIVARFALRYPQGLPADALERLIETGREEFQPFMAEPEVAAFWWPRFRALAAEFLDWEAERRPLVAALAIEQQGQLPLALADGSEALLTARADRIERTRAGLLRLIDFKSGGHPSKPQIEKGFAPQLTLEAAMARRVAFGDVPPGDVESVGFVSLKPQGGAGLAGLTLAEPENGLAAMAEEHLARLIEVLGRYRAGHWPYLSQRAPQYVRDGGPYEALARVKEWSRFAGGAEGSS